MSNYYWLNDADRIYTIHSINIGDLVYRADESYEQVFRVNNIYDYGVELIHSVPSASKEKRFVKKKEFVNNYIKIRPHGYIELTAIKRKDTGRRDLRVRAIAVLPDKYNKGEYIYHITNEGIMYEPIDLSDWFGNPNEDPPVVHAMSNGIIPEENMYYTDSKDYMFNKKLTVAISYYFGDSEMSILNLMDEMLDEYIESIAIEAAKNKIIDKNILNILNSGEWVNELRYMLEINSCLMNIFEAHDIRNIETSSYSYANNMISPDDMLTDPNMDTDLKYDIGDYPYYVTEYKIYMDLDKLKSQPGITLFYSNIEPDEYDNNGMGVPMLYIARSYDTLGIYTNN